MKKLVVMDYSNCSISVYDVTDIKNQDIDNYIDEHGLTWMNVIIC